LRFISVRQSCSLEIDLELLPKPTILVKLGRQEPLDREAWIDCSKIAYSATRVDFLCQVGVGSGTVGGSTPG
jgi:hypothetical protein